MRTSIPLLIVLSGLAGLQAASAVATSQAAIPAVLAQLRAQLDQVRSMPAQKPASLTRPDLAALVGLQRNQLTPTLGAPDYCDPPSEDGCSHSMHWAYFFYHWEPSARETSGTVEIAIPRQGWAVEIRFSESGAVNSATWVRQE